MSLTIAPMNLGDIFDQTFRLIGKTFVRNLIVALIILTPAALVFAWGLDRFFSTIMHLARAKEMLEPAGLEEPLRMFGAMALFFVSLIIYGLLSLTAMLGITIIACSEMNGQKLSWSDALGMTFGIRLWRLYGQAFLQYLALGGLIVIPYIALIAGAATGLKTLAWLGGISLFAAMICAIYLWIRWAFTLPPIACEEAGVVAAFRRSFALVQDVWWRTFGILILMSLIVQFAISIITTPLSFIMLRDFFAKYFEMLGSMGSGQPDSRALLETFDTFGMGLGLVVGVSAILSMLISPLIRVIMYFDLRARQGEFAPAVQSGSGA